MSEKTKRIIQITAFAAVAVGIAFALYWVFFRVEPEPTVEELTPEEAALLAVLPEAEVGAPTVVTEPVTEAALPVSETAEGGRTATTTLTTGTVEAASISSDGSSMNYYDPTDGKFYKINANGTVTSLSDQKFPNAENVVWAGQGDKAVIEFPDGSNIVYNFDEETQVTLPSHWEDFDFSPTGDEIIAKSIGTDPGNRWIVITSDDGTRTEAIAALGTNEDKVQINWSPNDQVVAFSDTGSAQTGFGRRMIIPIGKNDENYKGLIVEGLGFEAIWSPRGDRILYSVSGSANNFKPMLWIVDGSGDNMGDNRRNLGLETWSHKCTFSGAASLICAVPQNLPDNAGLQPTIAENTYDYLYQVDLNSGVSQLLAIPESEQSINNLTISSDGSILYYTNQFGTLNLIKL